MEQDIKSEGRCLYCGKMFSKAGIGRHLATHLERMEGQSAKKTAIYYHLEVSQGMYFLHLLVKGHATFNDIDAFLRAIWLECCGHLSSFMLMRNEIDMRNTVGKAFRPGLVLDYIYDWGSSTELKVKVIQTYSLDITEKLILLSRNEPLKVVCEMCSKAPAVNICTYHFYEDQPSAFCNSCSEKHAKKCEEFADYAQMPIVNSPRMGVCGYEGGTIDLERDKLISVQ